MKPCPWCADRHDPGEECEVRAYWYDTPDPSSDSSAVEDPWPATS